MKQKPLRTVAAIALVGPFVVFALAYLATDGFDEEWALRTPFRAIAWLVSSDDIKKVAPGESLGDYMGRALWFVVLPFIAAWCLWGAWLNHRKEERERRQWYGTRNHGK